ncbi:hypothetical protein, partial [Akkermansia sp.]|uniref:hypothetical protein n=1 Tax=Akkermansia sp. TaxID=1872421 RepID=UPI00399691E2
EHAPLKRLHEYITDLKSGVKPAHLKEKHFRKIPFANTPASTEAVLDVNKLSFHFKKAGRV